MSEYNLEGGALTPHMKNFLGRLNVPTHPGLPNEVFQYSGSFSDDTDTSLFCGQHIAIEAINGAQLPVRVGFWTVTEKFRGITLIIEKFGYTYVENSL